MNTTITLQTTDDGELIAVHITTPGFIGTVTDEAMLRQTFELSARLAMMAELEALLLERDES